MNKNNAIGKRILFKAYSGRRNEDGSEIMREYDGIIMDWTPFTESGIGYFVDTGEKVLILNGRKVHALTLIDQGDILKWLNE